MKPASIIDERVVWGCNGNRSDMEDSGEKTPILQYVHTIMLTIAFFFKKRDLECKFVYGIL
jgi:hypothetical protein